MSWQKFLQQSIKILLQLLLLWGIWQAGNWIVRLTGIMIPGNVVGMILLFLLLLTKIVRLDWVEQAAKLMLNHLAFLFIPITVGLMAWGDLARAEGFKLLFILAVGAATSLVITGLTAQVLLIRQQARAEKKRKQTALIEERHRKVHSN